MGPGVLNGLAADEAPEEVGEVLAPLAHVQIDAGAADRCVDLGGGADDGGVGEQARTVVLAEPRHDLRVEPGEGAPERLALAQDGDPRQAGLEAVEHQLGPEGLRVPLGHAPFLVVIGLIERIALQAPPCATNWLIHVRKSRAIDAESKHRGAPAESKRCIARGK